jgi:polyhydroxyalkanoate synthesis regulator protein
MSGRILLKKYANRRMYDTAKSTYVTLDQVAEMIRQGNQVCLSFI